MHPDASFVATLQRAMDEVELEAVVVGSVAAALQGAPVMTLDVDILIRDIIASKESAARPKDLAHLPILRDTLKVREAIAVAGDDEG